MLLLSVLYFLLLYFHHPVTGMFNICRCKPYWGFKSCLSECLGTWCYPAGFHSMFAFILIKPRRMTAAQRKTVFQECKLLQLDYSFAKPCLVCGAVTGQWGVGGGGPAPLPLTPLLPSHMSHFLLLDWSAFELFNAKWQADTTGEVVGFVPPPYQKEKKNRKRAFLLEIKAVMRHVLWRWKDAPNQPGGCLLQSCVCF